MTKTKKQPEVIPLKRPKGAPKRGITHLNDTMKPSATGGFGCNHCVFFQFSCPSKKSLKHWKARKVNERHRCRTWGVRSRGSKEHVDILFVGEAPGKDEDRRGKAFVGRSGQLLDRILKRVQIPLDRVRITNTIRCLPWSKADGSLKTPTLPEAKACSGFLAAEIQKYKPKVIVPLGGVALKAITGSVKGSILKAAGKFDEVTVAGHKAWLFPIHHPAYILRQTHLIDEYVQLFQALKAGLKKILKGKEPIDTDEDTSGYRLVTDPDEAVEAIKRLRQERRLTAYDLECDVNFTRRNKKTEPNAFRKKGKVALVGFSNRHGQAIVIPYRHVEVKWTRPQRQRVKKALRRFFADRKVSKVAQFKKFDDAALKFILKIEPDPNTLDTTMLAYAVDEAAPEYNLDVLVRKYTKMRPYKADIEELEEEYDYNFVKMPLQPSFIYSAKDVDATRRIALTLTNLLKQDQTLHRMATRFFSRGQNVLREMEGAGVQVDLDAAEMMQAKYEREVAEAEREMLAMKCTRRMLKRLRKVKDDDTIEFNVRSPVQIRRVLFRELKYPVYKRSKKSNQPSTDKESLEFYILRFDCAFCKTLRRAREANKMLRSFILVYLWDCARMADGRLHGKFNLMGTETGRLCVDGGTVLVTNQGPIAIKDLDVGEDSYTIRTHRGRHRRILRKFHKGREAMYEVVTETSRHVVCTKGHHLLTKRLPEEWTPVASLRVGDQVVVQDGIKLRTETVSSVTWVGKRDVWDIEVEEDHSYVAQGLIHHNSSSSPNLQQLPNRAGGDVKRLFVSRFGQPSEALCAKLTRAVESGSKKKLSRVLEQHGHKAGAILSYDYSQMELRILAALSKDETLLQTYHEGRDVHRQTMRTIFNMTDAQLGKIEAKDKKRHDVLRSIAKRVNFGIIYGQGPQGTVDTLAKEGVRSIGGKRITKHHAQKWINKLFGLWPGAVRWIKRVQKKLHRDGFVRTELGRVRHLGRVRSLDREHVAQAERQGPNTLIQSAASDVTLTALVVIQAEMAKRGMQAVPILIVHDSIVFDCPLNEIEALDALVRDVMVNVPDYGKRAWGKESDWRWLKRVPIKTDGEIGPNYRDVAKFPDKKGNGPIAVLLEQLDVQAVKDEKDRNYGQEAA